MKAARQKIAEQAKQRDCTQRMETQLWVENSSVSQFCDRLYELQTNTARKPLAKTHSVLILCDNKIFDLSFELHKVVVPHEQMSAVITGDADIDIIGNALVKALVNSLTSINDADHNDGKEGNNDDN